MRKYIQLVENTQIVDEVSLVTSLDDQDERYYSNRLWDSFYNFGAKRVGNLFGNYEFWTAKSPTGNLFAYAVKLDDDGDHEPVAYLALDRIADALQVDMIYVSKEERGNDLAYALYLEILKEGDAIISDAEQTKGGSAIWKKLFKDHRVHVTGVDEHNEEHEIENIRDYYDHEEIVYFKAVWVG